MCLNCRMLNPLSDKAAEILGVEKRKYLVFGNTLYDIMIENGLSKYFGYDCTVHNSMTMRSIEGDMQSFKKITVNGIDLYEGKLKIAGPLPVNKPPDHIDLYPELYEGDMIWTGHHKIDWNAAVRR